MSEGSVLVVIVSDSSHPLADGSNDTMQAGMRGKSLDCHFQPKGSQLVGSAATIWLRLALLFLTTSDDATIALCPTFPFVASVEDCKQVRDH